MTARDPFTDNQAFEAIMQQIPDPEPIIRHSEVMLGLPVFARTQPLEDVTLHMSCALTDAAEREDVSEYQRALLEGARKLIQMAGPKKFAVI
jgi:DNA-binding transcriptional regulator of glucitol operon